MFAEATNRILAGFFLLAMLTACGEEMPPLCKSYYRAPSSDRPKLSEYTLDEQVDLYLCGYRYLRPPTGDPGALAVHKEKILPILLDRLDNAEDDYNRWALFLVFWHMGSFDLDMRQRPEVLAALQDAIVKIKPENDWERRLCEKYLESIRKGPIVPISPDRPPSVLEAQEPHSPD